MFALFSKKEQAYINTVLDGEIILCDWCTRKEFRYFKDAQKYLQNECSVDKDLKDLDVYIMNIK